MGRMVQYSIVVAMVLGVAPLGIVPAEVFAQTTWHVDDDACPGPGSGSDVDPFCKIQDAIDAAALSGDEIIVSPGTYYELINFSGKGVHLHSTDPSDPDVVAATIVDGTGLNDSVVSCVSGEGPDTILEGFTITGGTGNTITFPGGSVGGGMFNLASSPTIKTCTFIQNSATTGGGMHNLACSPTVKTCTFIQNNASAGGGMYNSGLGTGDDSNPTVSNCTFIENHAIDVGGGMFNRGSNSSLELIHCTFLRNSSDQGGGVYNIISNPSLAECTFEENSANKGGAMFNKGSSPSVTSCTFNENICYYYNGMGEGGGIFNDNSSPTITYCTFNRNRADGGGSRGGGMFNGDQSNPTLTNCTFNENKAGFGKGGGMYNHNSNPWVTNCNFTNNLAELFGGGGGGSAIYNDALSDGIITSCVFEGNITEGGAMNNEGSSPTVSYCVFNNNTDDGMRNNYNSNPEVTYCDFIGNTGVGMSNKNDSSPTVTQCNFIGNMGMEGGPGGGMANSFGSSPIVSYSIFSRNSAFYNGGGMNNFDHSNPTVTHCKFLGNSAGNWGGGMYNNIDCNPTITNSMFIGNTAISGGGAIVNTIDCNIKINFCTFNGNTAKDGGGIRNTYSRPIITNSILWNDYPDEIANISSDPIVAYNNIEGMLEKAGNINADPVFVRNPYDGGDGWGDDPLTLEVDEGANDDFGDLRLQPGSPCINAGDPGFIADVGATDLDGHPRVLCDVVDMGAYEFGVGDYDCDQDVDMTDFAAWEMCFTDPGSFQLSAGCEAFDFNADGDVDLHDFAGFQLFYSGM